MHEPTPDPYKYRRQRNWPRFFLTWHRRLGIAAALFIIVLAATGVALNHASKWGLDRVTLNAEPVLALYGLEPDQPIVAFEIAEGAWIAWVDGTLYLDEAAIQKGVPPPVGAVLVENAVAVADRSGLFLFLPDGRLIERLDASLLPAMPIGLGRANDGRLLLATENGQFAGSPDGLDWAASDTDGAVSAQTALPKTREEILLTAFRGRGLPLDRVLLDLHSGRLFGSWAVLLADAVAILTIILASSGIYVWWKTRRR